MDVFGTSEGEAFFAEGNSSSKDVCHKDPDLYTSVDVANFSKKHLPQAHSTDHVFHLIQTLADLTVCVVVKHISDKRPQKWLGTQMRYPYHDVKDKSEFVTTGTGVVESITEMFSAVHGTCPCHECLASSNPREEWWKVMVNTATHVVFDTMEARSTVMECFYNSESDRVANVKNLYGLQVTENPGKVSNDWCGVSCATHDSHLAKRLLDLKSRKERILEKIDNCSNPSDKDCVVVISHPHGSTKKVSIGSLHSITIPAGTTCHTGDSIKFKDKILCRLPCQPYSRNSHITTRNTVKNFCCNITNTSIAFGNSIQLVPGAEFIIPEDSSFCLPPNAPYTKMILPSVSGPRCCTFPDNTRFFTSDGREFQLPRNTRFFGSRFDHLVGCLIYKADTCPGSGGACVLLLSHVPSSPSKTKQLSACQIFTHSFAMSDGLNKSSTGIFRYTGF